jgi:hypothetical protein
VLLYDLNYEEAFTYHAEALSLINELLNKTDDTNDLRTCSSCLFNWGNKCLEAGNTVMAKRILQLVLGIDQRLLKQTQTKENVVNIIDLYIKLIQCCSVGGDEDLNEYCGMGLTYVLKLINEDFDLCCTMWLKIADACYNMKAYFEAFVTYDTMAEEIVKKSDGSYIVLLIDVLINMAEIAFIDDGVEAGQLRLQSPIDLINEYRPHLSNEQDRIIFDQLEEKCNSLLARYA